MCYIRDPSHLINYINKFLRTSSYSYEKLPTSQEVIEKIWNKGLADRFTWVLVKEDHSILSDIDGFLRDEINIKIGKRVRNLHSYDMAGYKYSKAMTETCESLIGKPGVYSFWSKRKVFYIGTSVNLFDRIPSSFNEKRSDLGDPEHIYLRYIQSGTKSDAIVMEAYLIAKMKPRLNGTGKYSDELTLDLNIPKWSKYIKFLEVTSD